MKPCLSILLISLMSMGCSSNPNTPEHICEVYLSCINAQKWELASRYVFDATPSLLQLSPLLTKNYQYRKFNFYRADYGKDSSRVRVKGVLIYADETYLDSVFLLEKDSTQTPNAWKIKSL
ncbi:MULTISPECIES: hypothetical protein [Spirosoma]|uniref:hypothetical protein n=1 Tax=Spirosoma TaxID=107 RepID=UPI000367C9D0|nr:MULTISPECIES: hypothetical protein [Spirosoma]MBN8826768.1 hypothetical protein [Spirosoma sp.]OJW71164.1 MAG: hypothetical protein BGO59_27905 [Spirosoma sp. 48-14]